MSSLQPNVDGSHNSSVGTVHRLSLTPASGECMTNADTKMHAAVRVLQFSKRRGLKKEEVSSETCMILLAEQTSVSQPAAVIMHNFHDVPTGSC